MFVDIVFCCFNYFLFSVRGPGRGGPLRGRSVRVVGGGREEGGGGGAAGGRGAGRGAGHRVHGLQAAAQLQQAR